MAIAATGQLTQTLAQLRKRVASRFGDHYPLVASSNGATTTFIDNLNITTASEDMKGQWLVLSGGTKHRVTVFNDATNTITFVPAATTALTATGQTATLYNHRGRGFRPEQYDDAINNAINDAYPLGLIELYDDIVVSAFDPDSPTVTVPANFTHIHTVTWTDDDGFQHVLARGTGTNETGWIADPAQGKIRILGSPGTYADGLNINITGYGRQDILTADSDTCALNAEYVVARACYHLAFSALDKDEKFAQSATTYLNESTKLRTRVRTLRRPGSIMIRSA